MALNFRPYVRLTILGGLIVYFGAQALTGERGLLNEAERREALTDRRAELARLETERSELQARGDGLSAQHLSVDLLEERARVVLGFSGPDDYVIRDTTAS